MKTETLNLAKHGLVPLSPDELQSTNGGGLLHNVVSNVGDGVSSIGSSLLNGTLNSVYTLSIPSLVTNTNNTLVGAVGYVNNTVVML